MALLAIALGMSLATAMIAVGAGIGDKVSAELRSAGANIEIRPVDDTLDVNVGGVDLPISRGSSYIAETDLLKLKGIFWGHNVLAFAPFLSEDLVITVNEQTYFHADLIGTYFAQPLHYGKESFSTGVRTVNRWWKVEGEWPPDYPAWPDDQSPYIQWPHGQPPPLVLVGAKMAAAWGIRPGDIILANEWPLRVSGILDTGGAEDHAVVAPLHVAQRVLDHPDKVRRVMVSALTKPEDTFARRDPNRMSPADRDRWYCSPYANSIAYQIMEALPGVRAEQIRQVEQNQGKILSQVEGMMLLLTLAALLASALAVSAAMAASILERRQEVGLMKSLGASNAAVATLFLTEAGLMALAGGAIGFLAGTAMAHRIGQVVFGSPITVHPVILAVVTSAALLVTFLGSAGAVRKAMSFDPAVVLRGDA